MLIFVVRFVVTAAHCVNEKWIDLTVTLGKKGNFSLTHIQTPMFERLKDSSGEHDETKTEGTEFRSGVKQFGYTTHRRFRMQTREGFIEYDIAVLELEKPVDFDQYAAIR